MILDIFRLTFHIGCDFRMVLLYFFRVVTLKFELKQVLHFDITSTYYPYPGLVCCGRWQPFALQEMEIDDHSDFGEDAEEEEEEDELEFDSSYHLSTLLMWFI